MKEFISPNNFKIYVGTNCKENDELTFQIANDNDLWLHTKDVPGSHVVIKCNTKPDRIDLYFASELAAKYSKANNGKVYVDVCYKKDVIKPRKASYGEVQLLNINKSIIINKYN